MAELWYPEAVARPIHPESETQAIIIPLLVVFHTNGSPNSVKSLFAFYNRQDIPDESHFQLALDGTAEQYMPLNRRADTNGSANRFLILDKWYGGISVETQDAGWGPGDPGTTSPWSDAQVEWLVSFGVWMARNHAISTELVTSHQGPGFAIHRMFPQWTKNPAPQYPYKQCPGNARDDQFRSYILPEIQRRTSPVQPPSHDTMEFDMPVKNPIIQRNNHHSVWVSNGMFKIWIPGWNGLRQKAWELGLITDEQAWIREHSSYLSDGEELRNACVRPVAYLDGYGPTLPGTTDWPGAYSTPPDNAAPSVIA